MLTQPNSNTKTFGDHAFSFDAPRLWNELLTAMREPFSLDDVKRKLKLTIPKGIQPFFVKYYAAHNKVPINLYENRRYTNCIIMIMIIIIYFSSL